MLEGVSLIIPVQVLPAIPTRIYIEMPSKEPPIQDNLPWIIPEVPAVIPPGTFDKFYPGVPAGIRQAIMALIVPAFPPRTPEEILTVISQGVLLGISQEISCGISSEFFSGIIHGYNSDITPEALIPLGILSE